uniref:Uncharacterized protein n=1 Tax=Tanacetum cinerariifolium TaxID=118510 RepID=A0A699HNM7_TANCI|nr:hypothetical protein [Tanacetum cinerariifolium]
MDWNALQDLFCSSSLLKIDFCGLGWKIRTLGWRNTSSSRKKKLKNVRKCFTVKLLTITFNDEVSSEITLSCEPTVSSLNNEIDFRVSFDDFDDEDYTRYPFLRYQGLEYTDADIADFEERLERIYIHEIHRVQDVDFQGMPELMRDGLFGRMRMEHRDDAGVVVFTSRAWEGLFDTRGPLVREVILEFLSTLRFREEMESLGFARYWSKSEKMIPGKGDLHDYWRSISTDGDFLGPPLSYTLIRDPVLRFCHRMMAHSIAGRSQEPEKFVARLAEHFGLLTAEILGGLTVIASELLIIDMERQPNSAVGAPGVDEDAPAIDVGNQAILVPVQAPQQPPPPPPTSVRTIPQRLRRLEEEVQGLCMDVVSLRRFVERSMTDQGRFSTWMISCMAQLMEAGGLSYHEFDGTFRGSSHAAFQRRTRHRTGEANTSAAQQDPHQQDL